jgi:hypothetical protein
MHTYQKIIEGLHSYKIKYLIAGGFAVNFHQVQRATVDLDLILHLQTDNISNFILLMKSLGYVPRVPVRVEDFADPIKRKEWIDEKGMMVFTFVQPSNPFEIIDVFTEEPLPFDQLWNNRFEVDAFGGTIHILGIDDLITLKKRAGREKDEFDIRQLQKIKGLG